jgi:hypothetical protein
MFANQDKVKSIRKLTESFDEESGEYPLIQVRDEDDVDYVDDLDNVDDVDYVDYVDELDDVYESNCITRTGNCKMSGNRAA